MIGFDVELKSPATNLEWLLVDNCSSGNSLMTNRRLYGVHLGTHKNASREVQSAHNASRFESEQAGPQEGRTGVCDSALYSLSSVQVACLFRFLCLDCADFLLLEIAACKFALAVLWDHQLPSYRPIQSGKQRNQKICGQTERKSHKMEKCASDVVGRWPASSPSPASELHHRRLSVNSN
jgi:hypothetical protein